MCSLMLQTCDTCLSVTEAFYCSSFKHNYLFLLFTMKTAHPISTEVWADAALGADPGFVFFFFNIMTFFHIFVDYLIFT